MSKVHNIRLSRDALLKAVAQVVKDTSVGMATLDCVGMNAVLVEQGKGGRIETYPLDTIEVEMVKVEAPVVRKIGKLRIAAVDGVQVA